MDITENVMEIAASIEKDIPSRVGGSNRVFIRAVIARAIMAEREACAVVADNFSEIDPEEDGVDPYEEYEIGGRISARNIANAIRNRP